MAPRRKPQESSEVMPTRSTRTAARKPAAVTVAKSTAKQTSKTVVSSVSAVRSKEKVGSAKETTSKGKKRVVESKEALTNGVSDDSQSEPEVPEVQVAVESDPKPNNVKKGRKRAAAVTEAVSVPAVPIKLARRQVDEATRVMVMGMGEMGQLGLGEEHMERSRPTTISKLKEHSFVSVKAGGLHTVCLTSDGRVFTFGCNDDGSLGRTTNEEADCFEPGEVTLPEAVVQISAGGVHSACLTESGRVYLWGNFRDSNGLMGLVASSPGGARPIPELVRFPERVIEIASGTDHLVALGASGAVYTMGCPEQGRLGRVSRFWSNRGGRRGLEGVLTPAQCRLVGVVKRDAIFDRVWAGVYNTYARVKKTGIIVGCGLNNFKQMGAMKKGQEEELCVTALRPLATFNGVIAPDTNGVEAIASGEHHTLILDKNGRVYALGRSEYGRLGLGSNPVEKEEPQMIASLENCVAIAAGEITSYAITKDGEMYSWGSNTNQQLGHGPEGGDEFEPRRVVSKSLADSRVLDISGGGQHVALVATFPKES